MSTLKVDTILKRTGTGTITVGQSGDTISVPSGATLSVAGSTSGLPDMTPAFFATASGDQTGLSDNTYTKVTLATEVYDTNSAFTDSRFTVPSGEAGKYIFYGSVNQTLIAILIYTMHTWLFTLMDQDILNIE